MKSILTILSTAAALTAACATSGFVFDVVSCCSILCAAGIAGFFVSDYRRTSRRNLEPVKIPARQSKRRRPARAGVEFATLATMAG